MAAVDQRGWPSVHDTVDCVVTTDNEPAACRCSHSQMEGMGKYSRSGACMSCRPSASKAAMGAASMGQRVVGFGERCRDMVRESLWTVCARRALKRVWRGLE